MEQGVVVLTLFALGRCLMFHVGLDIHTKHIAICALDEKGQVVHRSQVHSIQDMVLVLTGLPDHLEVCYEASCGYGHFHDLLKPLATRVLVAHPGQLRLIFRSNTRTIATTRSAWPSCSIWVRPRRCTCPRGRSGAGAN